MPSENLNDFQIPISQLRATTTFVGCGNDMHFAEKRDQDRQFKMRKWNEWQENLATLRKYVENLKPF